MFLRDSAVPLAKVLRTRFTVFGTVIKLAPNPKQTLTVPPLSPFLSVVFASCPPDSKAFRQIMSSQGDFITINATTETASLLSKIPLKKKSKIQKKRNCDSPKEDVLLRFCCWFILLAITGGLALWLALKYPHCVGIYSSSSQCSSTGGVVLNYLTSISSALCFCFLCYKNI